MRQKGLTWLCSISFSFLFSSCSAATSLANSATDRTALPPSADPDALAGSPAAAAGAATTAEDDDEAGLALVADKGTLGAAADAAAALAGLSVAWLSAASRLMRRSVSAAAGGATAGAGAAAGAWS